ncbi:MAG TPA: hypothetical protein VFT16_00295 [Candidatus Saccharimonadales bacterium]|nr:hypothetical protein [Candidatus Saccharimonadales bacterium]
MWYAKNKRTRLVAIAVGIGLLFAPGPVLAASGTIQSQICEPFGETQITAPANDSQTTESTVHITGTAEPGITVSILRNGSGVGATTASSDGTFGIEVPIVGGNNGLVARGTNSCGTNHDSAAILVFRIVPKDEPAPATQASPEVTGLPAETPDIIPQPSGQAGEGQGFVIATPVITKPTPGTKTGSRRLWIKGSADPGSVVSIIVNGAVTAQVIVSEKGTFAALATLKEGANTIKVIASLSGQSAASEEISVIYSPNNPPQPQAEPKSTTIPPILIIASGAVLLGVSLYGTAAALHWLRLRLLHRRLK